MKKLLLTLFAVMTASFAFAGNGTKENPYTVADIQAMDVNNLATEELVWVKAYISGSAGIKEDEIGRIGLSTKTSFMPYNLTVTKYAPTLNLPITLSALSSRLTSLPALSSLPDS